MAKKAMAKGSKGGSKDYTKAIKVVRSEKTGAYFLMEEIVPKDKVSEFFGRK